MNYEEQSAIQKEPREDTYSYVCFYCICVALLPCIKKILETRLVLVTR